MAFYCSFWKENHLQAEQEQVFYMHSLSTAYVFFLYRKEKKSGLGGVTVFLVYFKYYLSHS